MARHYVEAMMVFTCSVLVTSEMVEYLGSRRTTRISGSTIDSSDFLR